MSNMRERHGGSMYPIGPSGLRAIVKELRNGKISVLLPDQVPNINSGAIQAEFFGNNIRYMSLIHKLLKKTCSEILFASVIRRLDHKGLKYEICLKNQTISCIAKRKRAYRPLLMPLKESFKVTYAISMGV